MRHEDVENVRYRLTRSTQTLDEAELLLQGGFPIGVTNRIYYACFYAVSALLLAEGHSSSKHTGVLSLFDLLWMKPQRLPIEMGKFYHLMFERRERGDYQDMFAVEKEQAEQWLTKARAFVHAIHAWFRDNEGLTLD